MGLYQAGAGVSVSPSGRHPVGIYKQTRGTAQWAVPLFRFSCPGTQEKGTPPPAPPPLRGGGELEAAAPPEASGNHCRTRRPRLPLVRHRPFGPGCGRASYWQSGGPLASAASAEARAALPERPTQTGSGCPLGGALPRSQRRAGSASGSVAAPASAPGVATPSGFRRPRRWHWPPRHPAPTGPPRSSGPGVSARSLPAPPTGCTRSLTGSRRCPRSMTPGTAAAPAPGCWLRCLRSMRSGTAAERLLRPEAAKGYGLKPKTAAPGCHICV